MALYQPEPVEISTRMRPGEWTDATLAELVASYRARIVEMGASASEVVEEIEKNDDGSVKVNVSWIKPDLAEEAGFTREGTTNAEGRQP
ncbi:hypothetical protein [Pseudarthrobacter sulfonivorans]|jgi:hypothetical protein|uniref:hypothetical protein n=1 Tax=Pseudarthrobacter sulfonivorans TaxID=121292 RepID=UPI00285A45F4|nr:hypothetical protein [Pseudarthrobacter sulfonivorans]MDR6415116.1 hypothetical protein [Pseudarthrobacter sulfonivorans]